jgi:hypothetical protein
MQEQFQFFPELVGKTVLASVSGFTRNAREAFPA